MDDAPYTGDLDLGAASTRGDLAALLRTVHIRADRPSLRALETMTRHSAVPLSKTTVAEMLKGVRFPRKAVMIAFLKACGVQGDGMESWLRIWERVAASEEALGRPGGAQTGPNWQGDSAVAGERRSPLPEDAEVVARAGKLMLTAQRAGCLPRPNWLG